MPVQSTQNHTNMTCNYDNDKYCWPNFSLLYLKEDLDEDLIAFISKWNYSQVFKFEHSTGFGITRWLPRMQRQPKSLRAERTENIGSRGSVLRFPWTLCFVSCSRQNTSLSKCFPPRRIAGKSDKLMRYNRNKNAVDRLASYAGRGRGGRGAIVLVSWWWWWALWLIGSNSSAFLFISFKNMVKPYTVKYTIKENMLTKMMPGEIYFQHRR